MDSLVIYTDCKKGYFDYNAWKPDSAFPIQTATPDCINELAKYEIIEHVFNGVGSERDEIFYANRLQKFKNGLIVEFLKEERDYIYLYSIEHRKKKASRIRSYKGLIDKDKIEQGHYLQNEVAVEQDNTIISFIASVDQSNIDYLLKYFFDDSTSFVIKSDNNYLNKEFLDLILSTLDLKSNVELDYLKLICLFCCKSDIIYRIGGDSGENYWSLQKFMQKNKCYL